MQSSGLALRAAAVIVLPLYTQKEPIKIIDPELLILSPTVDTDSPATQNTGSKEQKLQNEMPAVTCIESKLSFPPFAK